MQNMKDAMKYARYFQKLEEVVKIMCRGGKRLKQNTKGGKKKERKKNPLHVEKCMSTEKATKRGLSFQDMMYVKD